MARAAFFDVVILGVIMVYLLSRITLTVKCKGTMRYALSLFNSASDLMVQKSGIAVKKFAIAVADIRRCFLNQGNRIFSGLLLLVESL